MVLGLHCHTQGRMQAQARTTLARAVMQEPAATRQRHHLRRTAVRLDTLRTVRTAIRIRQWRLPDCVGCKTLETRAS